MRGPLEAELAGTALLSISGPIDDTAEQALVRGAIPMFESGANNEAVPEAGRTVPEAGRTDFEPDGFDPKTVTEALRVMR